MEALKSELRKEYSESTLNRVSVRKRVVLQISACTESSQQGQEMKVVSKRVNKAMD